MALNSTFKPKALGVIHCDFIEKVLNLTVLTGAKAQTLLWRPTMVANSFKNIKLFFQKSLSNINLAVLYLFHLI